METNESRFLLADEQDGFKEKASNLSKAMDDVRYVPSVEADSFLKSDPVKDKTRSAGSSSCLRLRKGTELHQDRKSFRADDEAMPPPKVTKLKRKRRFALPDHIQHPSKYTKYSLSDVHEDQMSQKSNTATALAFSRELDDRQKQAQEEDAKTDGGKILFKKPAHRQAKQGSEEASPAANSESSGTSNPPLKKTQPKSKKRGFIRLSHLECDDEN